jgi:hypothetical protein
MYYYHLRFNLLLLSFTKASSPTAASPQRANAVVCNSTFEPMSLEEIDRAIQSALPARSQALPLNSSVDLLRLIPRLGSESARAQRRVQGDLSIQMAAAAFGQTLRC